MRGKPRANLCTYSQDSVELGLMSRCRVRAVALLASLGAGCGSQSDAAERRASASAALPPSSTRLVDLSYEQALGLCEWESERLHAGYCLAGAIISHPLPADCAAAVELCGAPDSVAYKLLACASETLDPAKACEATVEARLRCAADLERQYAALPACANLSEAAVRSVLYRMSPESCVALRCSP